MGVWLRIETYEGGFLDLDDDVVLVPRRLRYCLWVRRLFCDYCYSLVLAVGRLEYAVPTARRLHLLMRPCFYVNADIGLLELQR